MSQLARLWVRPRARLWVKTRLGETVCGNVGEAVGDAVGKGVGEPICEASGEAEGESVGENVCETVGGNLGEAVGNAVCKGLCETVGEAGGEAMEFAVLQLRALITRLTVGVGVASLSAPTWRQRSRIPPLDTPRTSWPRAQRLWAGHESARHADSDDVAVSGPREDARARSIGIDQLLHGVLSHGFFPTAPPNSATVIAYWL